MGAWRSSPRVLPFTGRLAPFLWWSLGAEALGTQRDDRPKGVQILRRAASVSYQDDHRETAKLNGKQRENLGGKERDPLQSGFRPERLTSDGSHRSAATRLCETSTRLVPRPSQAVGS